MIGGDKSTTYEEALELVQNSEPSPKHSDQGVINSSLVMRQSVKLKRP